jgi:UDP-3-O-[3-hydroxymyristoyl] glucosamine N-acyltransferase
MPVLLAPDRAPALSDLLRAADTVGLGCGITGAADAGALKIAGIGSLGSASRSEISFLSNPRLQSQLDDCGAAAVILRQQDWDAYRSRHDGPPSWAAVLCPQPYLMYALLAQWFDRHRQAGLPRGIHPSAVIADDAMLADGVHVGPLAVIESGARLAAGVRIGAGCVIGAGSSIGADSLLHAHVTLYHGVHVGARAILHSGVVLGADGFGFAPDPRTPGAWAKIAQLGGVRIGDDVEIGANTTVDRGALDDTVIEEGVKIDNQVQIGHNVRIGAHSAIAGCVGIAGSARIGRHCTLGGAAMIHGHITLADRVQVSAGTLISRSLLKPGTYTGFYPFDEHEAWRRNAAQLRRLGKPRRGNKNG